MFKVGGFQLHKWASNDAALLRDILSNVCASSESKKFQDTEFVRVLGLVWSPKTDSFSYRLELDPITHPITKRKILLKISQIFDTLGWISPVVITGKLIKQQLWLKGVHWDEELPEDLRSYWQRWYSSLTEVAKIRIPRWDEFSSVATSIEMHGFSDAFIRAYGAVLYMRLCIGDVVKITLLQSKSKVAPTNTLSVPRLEFCGALLLVRLAWSCSCELRIEQQYIHLWTDSVDVLYWLQSHPSRWQSFVANRCSSIHELLPDMYWHHVHSADNSADTLSLGATSQELLESDIWWKGPSWLQLPREDLSPLFCHWRLQG